MSIEFIELMFCYVCKERGKFNNMDYLTKTELEIMHYFWSINIKEELTATNIRTHFSHKNWSKQVVSSFLTKLVKKNYLKVRKISTIKYYYSATITEEEYYLLPVTDTINHVFDGSYTNFIKALIDSKKDITEKELDEIEEFLKCKRQIMRQQTENNL